jgi:SNF2 family DNA or RNA helicase
MRAAAEQGLNQSKMRVVAALTRLRQVCCHPQLDGNESPNGKTDAWLEMLNLLVAEERESWSSHHLFRCCN